jgi:hypothetical protein
VMDGRPDQGGRTSMMQLWNNNPVWSALRPALSGIAEEHQRSSRLTKRASSHVLGLRAV